MSALPLGLIHDPQNPLLLQRLAELEAYDFSHITRSVQDKYGWDPDKSRSVEIETKKFFSLAFLDQGYYHIPEPDIDEYWHRMILHTQFYIAFCDAIFGGYYHHTPEPSDDKLNEENRNRTLELIPKWYGNSWRSVVKTCTQCRGPYIASNLQPTSNP